MAGHKFSMGEIVLPYAEYQKLTEDAALGAMVRLMPMGSELIHFKSTEQCPSGKWYLNRHTGQPVQYPLSMTPDEALSKPFHE